MNKYIFVIKDMNKITAEEILMKLKKEGKWVFKGGKQKLIDTLTEGEEVLVYKSGVTGGYFIGKFEINSKATQLKEELKESIFNDFDKEVKIKNVIFFEKYVYLKEIKDELTFVTNKIHWGSSLLHSQKKIGLNDFNKIVAEIKK